MLDVVVIVILILCLGGPGYYFQRGDLGFVPLLLIVLVVLLLFGGFGHYGARYW